MDGLGSLAGRLYYICLLKRLSVRRAKSVGTGPVSVMDCRQDKNLSWFRSFYQKLIHFLFIISLHTRAPEVEKAATAKLPCNALSQSCRAQHICKIDAACLNKIREHQVQGFNHRISIDDSVP